jgi:hypothetical protein
MRQGDGGGEGVMRATLWSNSLAGVMALVTLPLLASVDGTIVNRTTNKPAAGVTVRLTALGQGGMKPLGRTESAADGTFQFDAPAEGMYLLQANWQGVQYSINLPPNAPKNGVQMAIFDVKPKLAQAKAAQHLFFLESDGQRLVATEMIIYINESMLTWYDGAKGTARFELPKGVEAKDVKVSVTAPGGLPLERELTPGGAPGVYAVDYPVKPGETRFEISYVAPDMANYAGHVLEAGSEKRLVVPAGMRAAGDALEALGQEPQTHASIYGLKNASFRVAIQGTGSLRAAQPGGPAGGNAASTDDSSAQGDAQANEDGPRFEEILPPGYERNWPRALALIALVLAAGFAAMYVKGGARPASGSGRKG